MIIFLSNKFIAPRSLLHSKAWLCTQQSTRIVPVPQNLHQKAKPHSFLRTFSWGRERYWGSCYYLAAHSGSAKYRSQASKDSRYGSLCQWAPPPRGRSIHLHPTHVWQSTRSWEWLKRLDARLYAWAEKEEARSLIQDANQADLDKWQTHWRQWKSQGRHKLSKLENNLYEWERQGKAKLSTWQDYCHEDGEDAQKQAQLAMKDFEEFMRLIDAGPYGIIFGRKLAGRGHNNDKIRNQDSSWIGSDCPTRDFDIWNSGPVSMGGSKYVQKPEPRSPSHATRSATEEGTQFDGFEFDPISMRNIPKNLNSEPPTLAYKTGYAKNESSLPSEQFATSASFKAETSPPTQPALDEINKEHLSADSITAYQTHIGAKQHAQDWLMQEGFGIKKADLDSLKNGSYTRQHARDDNIKPSEIERGLNHHIKTKVLITTDSAKQPVLQHEAKETPGKEVDSLRANEARFYEGRSDKASVSEQHSAQTKTKDISITTAKIYGGEDPDHHHEPFIRPHEIRKAGPLTQDLPAGSSSKEQPAYAMDKVQAENSPLCQMIGKGDAQLPQQTTRVGPEEKMSSAQCQDVFGATSAKIDDTGSKSANSKFDSPPTITSPTMPNYKSGSAVKQLVEPEEKSLPERSSYKILSFDPTTQKVHSTQIIASVMPLNDEKKLGLLEAISMLTAPAKFLPHLTALGKSGYELVLASDTVMIFKKAKQTKRSPVEKISAEDGKYPRHINPIDGTMTQAGNFASPTGFVNHNAPVLPQVEDGRPVPLYDYDWSSGKANDIIHWQDKGSSGSRPRWEEHYNSKKDSRRTKGSESLPSLTSKLARFMGRCTRNILRIMGKTFIVVVWSLAFVGLCNAAQAAKSA